MNFSELDQKLTENKNYRIVANYIVENDIEITEFFEGLEVLNEEEGFFSGAGKKIDSWGQSLKDMWNKFRGRPYNVESVIDLLQRAGDYLKNNQDFKRLYKKEIQSLAKMIEDIKFKEEMNKDGIVRLNVPRVASGSSDITNKSDSGSGSYQTNTSSSGDIQSVDFNTNVEKIPKMKIKSNKNKIRDTEARSGVFDKGNEISVSSAGPSYSYTT